MVVNFAKINLVPQLMSILLQNCNPQFENSFKASAMIYYIFFFRAIFLRAPNWNHFNPRLVSGMKNGELSILGLG